MFILRFTQILRKKAKICGLNFFLFQKSLTKFNKPLKIAFDKSNIIASASIGLFVLINFSIYLIKIINF
jgi:hypothetical protein